MPRARHPDDFAKLAKRHEVIPRRDEPQPNGSNVGGHRTAKAVLPDIEELDVVTQRDVAEIFIDRYASSLRYCHTGSWFQWTGTYWRQNKTDLAFHFCREIAAELSAGCKEKDIKEARRANFANGVEKMARSAPRLAVTSENWNADPFLLGTPDGTIDLKTGELRAAQPSDGITKITAVVPADNANCPLWRMFLCEAMKQDEEKVRFVQQWFGYNLTGSVSEQKLAFFWGEGGNGKGVIIATVGGILGPYKREASMDTFVASIGDRHPTDLAHLFGARMVTAAETTEGRSWDEARIKQLTGGDVIAARFMRQDFFEYTPAFKLTIIGNHKPALRTVDDAVRRRFLIVPFTNKPQVVDPLLAEKLKAEWPGILRWMIEGCLDWQRNGLAIPASVVEATCAYFEGQDTFADWIDEACEVCQGNDYKTASPTTLFASWTGFAKRSNLDPGSLVSFGDKLESRGYPRGRKTHERYHIGIRLKPGTTYNAGVDER